MTHRLKTSTALRTLGADLGVHPMSMQTAKHLGTYCVDPGLILNDLFDQMKAYPTPGGLVWPFAPGRIDFFNSTIATALFVKQDADSAFILTHEGCKFILGAYKYLIGQGDHILPINKLLTNTFVDESVLDGVSLRQLLTELLNMVSGRGDNEILVVRALTELLLTESPRNLSSHVVNEAQITVGDYMRGEVDGHPRLDVEPALALDTGEILYLDPDSMDFKRSADIRSSWVEKLGSVDKLAAAGRRRFAQVIERQEYDRLIVTPDQERARTTRARRTFTVLISQDESPGSLLE